MAGVISEHIGGHLQRTVEHHPQRQLVRHGAVHAAHHARLLLPVPRHVRAALRVGHVHDAGRVVHGASQPARKRQQRRVPRRIAVAPRLPLLAAHALARHQVRPGAAQARGLDALVHVEHDPMLRGQLRHALEVAHHVLPEMVLTGRTHRPGIARLHHADAQRAAPREGLRHHRLVVRHVAAGLVVTDQLHAAFARMGRHALQVQVGRGRHLVEAGIGAPAVPARVPAFEQHRVHAGIGRGIDAGQRACGGGAVALTGRPRVRAQVHLPPDAQVGHRADPRWVGDAARFVQVEQEVRGEQARRIGAHQQHAPRGAQRAHALHARAIGPGHQVGAVHAARVLLQRHGRVVHQRGLVHGQVDALARAHRQRRVHPGGLAQGRVLEALLLRVVVGPGPPRLGIQGQGQLAQLLQHHQAVAGRTCGHHAAEGHTLIAHAELHLHATPLVVGLAHVPAQPAMVVA